MSNYSLKSPETSQEWEDYLLFRWEILRKPLGMSQESLADSIEEESFHVMGIDSQNEVIASGRIHFNTDSEALVIPVQNIITELENIFKISLEIFIDLILTESSSLKRI